MGDVLFNESAADRQVLVSLLRETLKKLGENMPLLQLNDGTVIRVENYEVVSADQLQHMITNAQNHLSELQSFNQPTQPATDVVDAPAAPADPAPAADPQPQPAPVDQGVPAPEVAASPVDQPPLQ